MVTPDDVLARALGYPYERPAGSFLFEPASGGVTMFDDASRPGAWSGRTVVLAVGSNAAPVQLRRKFGETSAVGDVIPVVTATLVDHDVVYAAMVAGYGSIPATSVSSPGTRCSIHATLLTDAQLERMNETEGVGRAYDLVEVAPHHAELGAYGDGTVLAYVARAGALLVEGSPIALAEIEATGRRFRSWPQPEMLAHVAAAEGLDVARFVIQMTGDPDRRQSVNRQLAHREPQTS